MLSGILANENQSVNVYAPASFPPLTYHSLLPLLKVMIAEAVNLKKERYLAIVLDRESTCPVVVVSSEGGINIEDLARRSPASIHREKIDIIEGVTQETANKVATALGFKQGNPQWKSCAEQIIRLYKLFTDLDCLQSIAECHLTIAYDSVPMKVLRSDWTCFRALCECHLKANTLSHPFPVGPYLRDYIPSSLPATRYSTEFFLEQVEVNPLGETVEGKVVNLDAKFVFDSNAIYRQPRVAALAAESRRLEVESAGPNSIPALEFAAENHGLTYIGLPSGNIGCMVNGAGLAMATLDILGLFNGRPANFLDLGGRANQSDVAFAIRTLTCECILSLASTPYPSVGRRAYSTVG
ncbi:unnamed protein product [Schistocephalus solidus]|uniref:ATP-grasp_2 domain-containing protein n=1 Tax=Schistocephalus solidus TaxID=70667 RepID=A0A183TM52_SCHSO|nr:unnamed protein product [Schistocephalus solidus]